MGQRSHRENHVAIFEGAGFKVNTYPRFDSETNGVRVTALLEKLATLPEKSIVLLHPCCHNPTGSDLTNAQWDEVVNVLKARNLIPFLDIAYPGLWRRYGRRRLCDPCDC